MAFAPSVLCLGVIGDLAKGWSLSRGLPAASTGMDGTDRKQPLGLCFMGLRGMGTIASSGVGELMCSIEREEESVSVSSSSGPLKEITERLVI